MGRKKHIPQRMCVVCRESQAKKSLIRLVRTPDGVVVDPGGKEPGRGAYIHLDPDCWQNRLQASLERSLKIKISPENMGKIEKELSELQEIQE
jgi:predicted RNA-binding protein YlxR (DUF448 family)